MKIIELNKTKCSYIKIIELKKIKMFVHIIHWAQ